MHALTIFAVHESVEGERRLRAVRTDHDNFRCRALHPRLPAQDHPIILKKTFRKTFRCWRQKAGEACTLALRDRTVSGCP